MLGEKYQIFSGLLELVLSKDRENEGKRIKEQVLPQKKQNIRVLKVQSSNNIIIFQICIGSAKVK